MNPESHPVSGRSGDVLGEPVMTANPLITRAQAAAILGVPRQRVYQMVLAGILRAEDGHKDRRYRLRDVEALTVPITTHEAAAILACDIDAVLELIRTGALARTGDALRPVRRGEVEWRATLRQPFLVRHNTVDVRTAAAILGIPEDDVRDLAQQDLLPVRRTRNRGYRFRREHLELIANAWRAAEEHNRSPRS